MILETERLVLRELKKEDFAALYKVFSDKEISKFYPYDFDEERVSAWRDWVSRKSFSDQAADSAVQYILSPRMG